MIADERLLSFPVEAPTEYAYQSHSPPAPPPSPDFAASYAIFLEGHAAYKARDYPRAADLFVKAALQLRVRSGLNAPSAARNRAALYDDAAQAWIMADTRDEGRRRLRKLQKTGEASAEDLARAYAALDGP